MGGNLNTEIISGQSKPATDLPMVDSVRRLLLMLLLPSSTLRSFLL
jgi:hypothetical protein